MMERSSSSLGISQRFSPWPTALTGIIVIKAALSLAGKPGSFLVSYSGISYFLLLIFATTFAIRNAIQSTLGSRRFWVFFAIGCGLWSLDQSIDLYYELGLHIEVPNSSIADPILFLHIVPFMAALAAFPHRRLSDHSPYRAVSNALLLLSFWGFLYGYLVLPYEYLASPASYALRFDVLYLIENVALILAVGILALRVPTPWMSIYRHLFGASVLYALGSAAANLAIDSGGYVNGKLYGLGLTISVCWFVWIPLRARQLSEAEEVATQSSSKSQASSWPMFMAVVISVPILGELLGREESTRVRTLRLLVAIAAIVGLVCAAYIKEQIAKHQLDAHVSRRVIDAEESERRRIAEDLHEDIGQRLALLAIEIERLKTGPLSQTVEMLTRIDELWKHTMGILTDVKASAHELHSPRLEYLGLAAVMRSFCEEFDQRKGVEIAFKSHDLPSFVPPDISLCLFRVLQEALYNAVKHSGVRHFEVELRGQPGEIHLTVIDSGAGFDTKEARGLGLTGMQERLKLLKGMFSIDSQPQHGTRIHARVPLSSGSDSMCAAG